MISIKLLTLSNEKDDGEEKTFWEDVKDFFNVVLQFILWLPLILSSLIYKVGSMLLYYLLLESYIYASLMVAGIFIGNFLTCFLLEYVYILEKTEDDNDEEKVRVYRDLPFREKMFVSYSNIFVFSGPVQEANNR